MSTARLAFLDLETTGLDLRRHELWEIGLIVRQAHHERELLPDGTLAPAKDAEYLFQIHPEHLRRADPQALQISQFTQRFWRPETPKLNAHAAHAAVTQDGQVIDGQWAWTFPGVVADQLFGLLTGAVIVGSNVGAFDVPMLSKFMRRWGFPWTAYYHPINVPDLVAGYAAHHLKVPTPEPPYRSSELYRRFGVDISGTDARHTALGDARRERDMYDIVMGNGKSL